MSQGNKINHTDNNKKEDGRFKKKNIKHGIAESTRAAFYSEKSTQTDEIKNV